MQKQRMKSKERKTYLGLPPGQRLSYCHGLTLCYSIFSTRVAYSNQTPGAWFRGVPLCILPVESCPQSLVLLYGWTIVHTHERTCHLQKWPSQHLRGYVYVLPRIQPVKIRHLNQVLLLVLPLWFLFDVAQHP